MSCGGNFTQTVNAVNAAGASYRALFLSRIGTCSPRVNGKIKLRANTFSWTFSKTSPPPVGRYYTTFASQDATEFNWTKPLFQSFAERLRLKLATKFRDKVRGSSASMGITITQWGQSHDMITKRTTQAANWLKASLQKIELMTPRQRRMWRKRVKRSAAKSYRKGDPLASVVLEGEFGWKPLFDDVGSAMEVLSSPLEKDRFIKAKSSGSHSTSWVGSPGVTNPANDVLRRFTCDLVISASARVRLENPNTSLASRLGLLNPVGIVWDAIPFSFLVNMFSNMGSLLRNLQWEAGCQIIEVSTTETRWSWSSYRAYNEGFGQNYTKRIGRSLTPPPYRPKFQLKFPNLNGETMLIMVSLALQRFSKIAALARVPL